MSSPCRLNALMMRYSPATHGLSRWRNLLGGGKLAQLLFVAFNRKFKKRRGRHVHRFDSASLERPRLVMDLVLPGLFGFARRFRR